MLGKNDEDAEKACLLVVVAKVGYVNGWQMMPQSVSADGTVKLLDGMTAGGAGGCRWV